MINPKISVIVPVYNSEKYLAECLDSLIYQTYKNLEIICVNDGSTDKSSEILQTYAQKDGRIKVYTEKNSGAAVARNFGLQKATGDYVSFVDSDDWVLLNLYDSFVQTLNKVKDIDIYMFNTGSYQKGMNDVVPLRFFDIGDWQNHQNEESIHTPADCVRPFSRNISAANKIFNREFLRQKQILFPEKLKYEDFAFHFKALFNAKKIIITDRIFYRYRRVEGSVSEFVTPKCFDIFAIVDIIEENLQSTGLFEQNKYALFQYKYNVYGQHFTFCPPDLQEKFFAEMKKRVVEAENGLDYAICQRLTNYFHFLHIKLDDFAAYKQYSKTIYPNS